MVVKTLARISGAEANTKTIKSGARRTKTLVTPAAAQHSTAHIFAKSCFWMDPLARIDQMLVNDISAIIYVGW